MKPKNFIFIISFLALYFKIKYLNYDVMNKNFSILNIYLIINTFMILLLVHGVIFKNYKNIKISHIWGNVTLLLSTIITKDYSIILYNTIFLSITVLSRLYYNDCAISMVIQENKKDKLLNKKTSNINSIIKLWFKFGKLVNLSTTDIYSLFLLVNIYKLYYFKR